MRRPGIVLDAKGAAFTKRLARYLKLPRKPFNCNGSCHGTFTEWFDHTLPGSRSLSRTGHGLSKRQRSVTGTSGLLRSVGAHR